MNFQLAPEAEEKKVFLADFSELSDRFDPEMVLFRRKSHNFRFPTRKLQEFFRLPPQYGANERGIERTTNTGPRYVRITDINEFGYLSDELGATAEVIEPQYLLNENDLLFARSGNTVGKCYIHKQEHAAYDCFFAGYLIRLCFEDEEILPDYIFALTQLPYYKSWVKAIQRTSGQPNINAQEYANLEVCAAPRPIQEKIVERLEAAYAQKREVETQAKAQLARIDEILLAELGITPPVPTPDAVERCFFRQFSEVTGERIDPLFWRDDLFSCVRGASCELVALGGYSVNMMTGFAAGKNDQGDEEDGVIQIRPTNINDDRELIFKRNIYIHADEVNERQADLLMPHEVLFNNTNSQEQVGKTVFFDSSGDYFCSNHITRIVSKDELDPQFLTAVLNLYQRQQVFFRVCTNWNNQSGVGRDVLEKLLIPLPPRAVQDAIVVKIEELRQGAKTLFAQAQAELDAAKVAIEGMILGEG